MILIKTLNVNVEGNKFFCEGKEIPNITIENETAARRTVSISPKHRETYLSGCLLTKGSGYIYVVDEEGAYEGKQYFELTLDGVLIGDEPSMNYAEYHVLRESKRRVKAAEIEEALTK